MSGEITTTIKTVVARKEHNCCCYGIYCDSGYGLIDIPEKYHGAIKRMEKLKGKIQLREEHFEWSGKFDGEIFKAKANKDMYDLITEMEWFD